DLFAGSGGLGIEALSRGMDKAVFIDMESKSIDVIKENLRKTGLEEQAEVFRNDAGRALKVLAKRGAFFDAVFLDPPYRLKHGDELMSRMAELDLLRSEAVIVLEYESGHKYPESFGQFEQVRKAVYGETTLSIYRFAAEQPDDAEHTEAGTETSGIAESGGEDHHD
ncbi:16S rRNA (guanine(966)-N(2))-methyltransferase RsmD, partial [Paenibacillus sp. 28ISP30-2]|nr:16S rRNA (guanine(966)-N(2))-methyltransferase RsmD [Paenibacillus sp. 28ISP30-2]